MRRCLTDGPSEVITYQMPKGVEHELADAVRGEMDKQ